MLVCVCHGKLKKHQPLLLSIAAESEGEQCKSGTMRNTERKATTGYGTGVQCKSGTMRETERQRQQQDVGQISSERAMQRERQDGRQALLTCLPTWTSNVPEAVTNRSGDPNSARLIAALVLGSNSCTAKRRGERAHS